MDSSPTVRQAAGTESRTARTDPAMLLQRPSSARAQEITHILNNMFRDVCAHDPLDPDTIQNLIRSRGSDDQAHEQYVNALEQVQVEREKRYAQCATLERHIMQAEAKAQYAHDREVRRRNQSASSASGRQQYTLEELGVQPVYSHYRSVVDERLLESNGLITPSNYTRADEYRTKQQRENILERARKPSSAKVTTKQKREASPTGESDASSNADDAAAALRALAETGDEPAVPRRAPSGPHSAIFSAPSRQQSRQDAAGASRKRGQPSLLELAERYKQELRDLWMTQITNEERELARNVLHAMYARNRDYHKNPRFDRPGRRLLLRNGTLPDALLATGADDTFALLPQPKAVLFDAYEVGKMYEQELRLTNVTNTMRMVRVVPPATQYFSVGLGRFPEGSGLIAPGMCCVYAIRFAPDCLGQFEDSLLVQVADAPDLRVPLVGCRPPPRLRLSNTFDCGECVLLGTKVCRFAVRNDGGMGRFCVLSGSQWPPGATLSSTLQPGGLVSVGAFEVRPSMFQLAAGQSAVLEVLFVPHRTGLHEEQFVMLCNNCQVRRFRLVGRGQSACVALASVQDGLGDYLPAEPRDVSALHLVRFEPLHPFTYTRRRITVRNPNAIQFSFNWKVIKPCFVFPSVTTGRTDSARAEQPAERIIDVNSAFLVEPANGVLESLSETEFLLTFAPTDVQRYDSVAHLVLENIPDYTAYVASQALIRAAANSKPSTPSGAERGSRRGRPSTIETVQESSENNGESQTNSASANNAQVLVTEVTVLEIELVGNCVPFAIEMDPPALVLNGTQYVGVTVKRSVRLQNNGFSTVRCAWQSVVTSDYIINVESAFGMIRGRGGEASVDVCVTGLTVGTHRHAVRCAVNRDEAPSDDEPLGDCTVELPVEFTVHGAHVETNCGALDFGLVRLTESRTLHFELRNPSPIVANWRVTHDSGYPVEDAERNYDVTFSMAHGGLRPLETLRVAVQLDTLRVGLVDSLLVVEVEHGNRLVLAVRGEIQAPYVYLLDSMLRPEAVYLQVESQCSVQLHNATLLPTHFAFGQPQGLDSAALNVTLEPSSGVINAHETLPVILNFTPQRLGSVRDFHVPCTVADPAGSCVQTLVVRLECDVQDLRFTVTWLKVESVETRKRLNKSGHAKVQLGRTRIRPVDEPQCVEIGRVELNTHDADAQRVPIAYLRVRNDTAIPTQFRIDKPYFASAMEKEDVARRYPELMQFLFAKAELELLQPEEAAFESVSRQPTGKAPPPDDGSARATREGEGDGDGDSDLHTQLARAVATMTERSRTDADGGTVIKTDNPGETDSAASRNANESRGGEGRKAVELVLKPNGKEAPFALRDCFSEILRSGRGAAFLVTPTEGYLQAYQEVLVEIRAFADIWGDYHDTLTLHVGQLERQVPLHFEAVGCPLDVQLTATMCDRDALCILRMGSHLVDDEPYMRAVRVNNHSPFDLRVDWRTFHLFEEDRKLLDLISVFGRAFPQLASDSQPDDTQFESESARVDLEPQSRPRLIRLILRPRDGFECPPQHETGGRALLSVQPAQLVVPARSHALVHARFDTRAPAVQQYLDDAAECANAASLRERSVRDGIDIVSYSLGYVSVDDPNVANVEGKVTRKDTYDAAQLRIDVTARVVEPQLEYSFSGDIDDALPEKFVDFVTYASDLFDMRRQKMMILTKNMLSIRNAQDTPTYLSLATSTPFALAEWMPKQKSVDCADLSSNLGHVVVPIRGTTKICVALVGTKRLLQFIEQIASASGFNDATQANGDDLRHLEPHYVDQDGAWPPPFKRMRKVKVEIPQLQPALTMTTDATRLDSTRKAVSERSSRKDEVSSKKTDGSRKEATDVSSKKDSETSAKKQHSETHSRKDDSETSSKKLHSEAHSRKDDTHSRKDDSEAASKRHSDTAASKRETNDTPSRRHATESFASRREESEHDSGPKFEERIEWVEDPIAFQQQIRSRRIECQVPLDVVTSTGHRDTFVLLMRIELPALKLSAEQLDFGTCFCAQTRELHVTIVNVGLSDATWSIEQETDGQNKEDVFEINPARGRLPGLKTTNAHNRQSIRVFFTAKHDTQYEVNYRIVGPCISEPIKLTLKGIGSFDSKYKQTYGL